MRIGNVKEINRRCWAWGTGSLFPVYHCVTETDTLCDTVIAH